jgi:hypothetical protein
LPDKTINNPKFREETQMALNLQVENAINTTAQSLKDQNGNTSSLTLSTDNVGIGTMAPKAKLHVAVDIVAGSDVNGQKFIFHTRVNGGGDFLHITGDDANGSWQWDKGMSFVRATGNVGIGTTAPREKLEVNGNIVTNGDIRLTNADCAEDFDICETEQVEPGTVMVLGEEGVLYPSQQAYDKRVAGVVSGAGDYRPGIVLDKQLSESNRQPIALLGKVFCKVDAQYGVIEVGDLLTTSPTPGHAMKADDPLKAFGTVIGKALRPLAEGQGLIPILIALQ